MAQGNLPTVSSGDGGLSSYLSEVRKYPMLEPQEEFMLAKAYQEHGDRAAVEKMVTSHLRLVAKVAMGYRGYGLPIGEVVSEGNVGLMKAVKKFDPDKGFRLATYAMWWIKASIQEYVLRSWSLVKIGTTASQKRLFFNLRKVKGQIQAVEDGDLRPEQVKTIASRLGVSESDVLSMNQRMSGDKSLNAPIRTEDGAGEFQDWLVDEGDTPDVIYEQQEELDHRRALLKEAMDVLDERESRIFQARRIEEPSLTLEQLSEEFDVSRERIRQIEVRAFEKVQRAVKRLSRESMQSNIDAIEAPNH